MHGWRHWLLLIAASRVALSNPQVVLERPSTPYPAQNGTGNLIFQSVSSLLQRWPNTKHANGHTIAAAFIPTGTVLYHGHSPTSFDKPDWLGFDPEHSFLLCRCTCQFMSFVTTRKLRLGYLDGSSGANTVSGTLDSQDIMIWGKIRPEIFFNERERIAAICGLAKQYGLDGFIRMEMDFEIMKCDFLDGLQLVSNQSILASTLLPFGNGPRGSPLDGHRLPHPPHLPPHGPDKDSPWLVIPEGWRGSVRSGSSASFEVVHAGSWHNRSPGETRVYIDYSRLVSFFDPALTSLAAARVNQDRLEHRILGISSEDIKDVRDQILDIFTRDGEGSGINWGSIAHVIIERYSARLELVQHLLKPSTIRNVTEQAAQVRTQVFIMLTPYMLTSAIPWNETGDRSWVAPITKNCASTLTSWAPVDTLTRQEKVVKNAIDEVLQEICSVLGDIWVDAFGVEDATVEDAQSYLNKWSKDINRLMGWLDWSVWDTCQPACGPEEMCYIPTWPWFEDWWDRGDTDMTPKCISRLGPHNFEAM